MSIKELYKAAIAQRHKANLESDSEHLKRCIRSACRNNHFSDEEKMAMRRCKTYAELEEYAEMNYRQEIIKTTVPRTYEERLLEKREEHRRKFEEETKAKTARLKQEAAQLVVSDRDQMRLTLKSKLAEYADLVYGSHKHASFIDACLHEEKVIRVHNRIKALVKRLTA